MLERILAVHVVVAGLLVFATAKRISDFEKRLADAHSWIRVTGWSGTRKGVLCWKAIGAIICAEGTLWLLIAMRLHYR